MDIKLRNATSEDILAIVRMLADDFLGTRRELITDPLPESYLQAFVEIEADPSNELLVAELDGRIVGTMQLTFTPSLSHQGSRRCTIEAVRVDRSCRGRGIGHEMMRWAIKRAREKSCGSIQLTTNAARLDAQRFYESVGFEATHVGMKLSLS